MKKFKIYDQIRREEIKTVHLQFSDIIGNVKFLTITIGQLPDLLRFGIWIDSSEVEGLIRICDGDLLLKPDFDTFRIVTQANDQNEKIAKFECAVFTQEGAPVENDVRNLLDNIFTDARNFGLEEASGNNLEAILFKGNNVCPLVFADHIHNN